MQALQQQLEQSQNSIVRINQRIKDLENELMRTKDEAKADKQKLEQDLEKTKTQNYQSATDLSDLNAEIQRLKDDVANKDK